MTGYRLQGLPARRPSHRAALLREDVLPRPRLTVKAAAAKLSVSRRTPQAVLSERVSVTPEMPVRLGKLCGHGPAIWLGMPMAHDLRQAKRDFAETVKHILTLQLVRHRRRAGAKHAANRSAG